MSHPPEFEKLSPTNRAFLMRVIRRLALNYEGEISLFVKSGGIYRVRWTTTDDGDSVQNGS